MQSCNAQLDT
jgi:hypothetical protein